MKQSPPSPHPPSEGISLERLQAQLASLRAQREQALKQLGACEGGIQTIEFLIQEIMNGEDKADTDETSAEDAGDPD